MSEHLNLKADSYPINSIECKKRIFQLSNYLYSWDHGMKVPMCFVCCIVNRYNMGRIVNGTILAEEGARPNIQSTTFNLSFCLKAKLFKYLNVLNTWGNKLLLSIHISRPQRIGDRRERERGGGRQSRYSFNNIQYSLLPNIRGLSSLPPPG